jgi:hypothetical protein
VRTWEANDPDFGRSIAAPLDHCVELLSVDLATNVQPYIRPCRRPLVWSLMQLERQLRPEAFHRRRGGYIDRRRSRATGTDH